MPKAINFEIRDRAKDLSVIQGLTLEQVSAETGVSLSQLKTWSSTEGWTDLRDEYRQSLEEIKLNTVRLRRKLVAKALESLDPQAVYAAAALEKVAQSVEKNVRGNHEELAAPAEITREIRTPEQAIAALQEATEIKLNMLLSRPGEINLSIVRDLERVFALITDMKGKYLPAEQAKEEKRQLDAETLRRIREEVYGLR